MNLEGMTLGVRAFRSYRDGRTQMLSDTPVEKLIDMVGQLNTIQEQLKTERDGLVSQSGSSDPGNYINLKLKQVLNALDDAVKEAINVDKAINEALDKPSLEAKPESKPAASATHHIKSPGPDKAKTQPPKPIKVREPIKGCTGIEAFEEYQSIKPKPRDPSEKLHTAIDWLDRNADLLEEELADMVKRGYQDTPIYKATLDTLNEVVKEKIQLEEYADTVVTGPVDDENLARILQEEWERESAPISSKTITAHPTYPGILPEADHDGLARVHPAEHNNGNSTVRLNEPRVDLRPAIADHTPLYSDMEMTYTIFGKKDRKKGLRPYLNPEARWSPVHQPVVEHGHCSLNIIPYLDIVALIGNDIDSMIVHSSENDIVVGIRMGRAYWKSTEFNHEEIIKDTILVSKKYAELVRRDTHEGVKQIELRRVNGITLRLDTYATLRLLRLKELADGRRPRAVVTTLVGITGVVPQVYI